jgi:DNA repair exonuclease SbcCD ATPase subunit
MTWDDGCIDLRKLAETETGTGTTVVDGAYVMTPEQYEEHTALRAENAELKAKLGEEDMAYRELRDGYDNQQQRIAELEAALREAHELLIPKSNGQYDRYGAMRVLSKALEGDKEFYVGKKVILNGKENVIVAHEDAVAGEDLTIWPEKNGEG